MLENDLRNGLEHGFIDEAVTANENCIPQLLTNNPSRGEKVITSIKAGMSQCDEFMFSVAFITYDGIHALLNEFKLLKDRGIKGRIIASQYQNFTDPKALKKLRSLENIEVRIVTEEQIKMHSKCYIFRKGGSYDIIIGSSNLTNNALCTNGEWNLKITSMDSGDVVRSILREFEYSFEHATPVTDFWIESYSLIYNDLKDFRRQADTGLSPAIQENKIVPNSMQAGALQKLKELRDAGETRALVISATGSGKTFLSAFDAKVYGGKYLYLVHRKPILNKSMESFRKVLGPSYSIEQYDPRMNNLSADCLFSTIQTMSKQEVLDKISPEQFDYILIDEVHHAGAETYQRVINHFKPKFLVGMTATPDRSDDYDIYSLFDHNIAYEIRLKQAMDLKLVCPFHYFGITDMTVDEIDYEHLTDFNKLDLEKRVDHILQNIDYYGYSGPRLKGIVFCSKKPGEARTICSMFNARGYRSELVTYKMDKEDINTLIERLEADSGDYCLDFIFTVDLFNEGVDIPSINQVVMLRPTESPIVYIQQLGRGLRLHSEKDFVTILDFIGNYEKNYNIPIALSDDHSYSKIEARRFVATGDSIISGNSTISFDEISKAQIYQSIDRNDFRESQILMKGYKDLKNKLGRIPDLTDYKEHGTIDALNILSKYKSYHRFLSKKEKEYEISFPQQWVKVLEYITKICAPGKRLLEIETVEAILDGSDFNQWLGEKHPELSENAVVNITNLMNGTFYNNELNLLSPEFGEMISDPEFKRQIEDVLRLGRSNREDGYRDQYEDTNFVLNRMYTYDDVCRLMNWRQNVNAQNIGGYKFDAVTNTFSVFINYHKDENVVESQRYEDHFENRHSLIALSKPESSD